MVRKFSRGKTKRPYKKKKKEEEFPVENTIYEFTPSRTGDNTINGHGKTPRHLKKLYKDTVAIKKHLETHLNSSQDSKFLLSSVVIVLRLVARFNRESRDMPFDWTSTKLYPQPEHNRSPERSSRPRDAFSVKRSKANETKNDVCVTKEVKDPNCLTLCGLRRLVAQATPSPLVVKGHAWIPPLLDPNTNCAETYDLPLNDEEKKIWLKFKKHVKGIPEVINLKFIEEGKRSIELDHPIVSLIGNFAVVAFNEECEMHVKKGEHNNLHDFEVMECKYLKITKTYYFYMTIEAIEEGNIGVYETIVVCNNEGKRTLGKFVLTDRTPTGTKAMAISLFSYVRSMCKSLADIVRHKMDRLDAIHKYTRGRGEAYFEMVRLSKLAHKTLGGLRKLLSLKPPLFFPQECIRTTSPDGWSYPDDNYNRMVRRPKGTPCRGYDYDYPFCIGSVWC